ncbi:hypothetical protein F5Y12DRAFT_731496 [Xylaria sp. FL1777]|nr:hypothetical protein F5Y12DRAFT_731496 [Xylaria sp. FL1777]
MHHGKRVENLKRTLNRVAQITQSMDLDQSGINIRFLNYTKDDSGDFDNMTDLKAISRQVNDVFQEKRKGSKLGGKLEEKIIDPFVKKRIQNHDFKKPIIVLLITDGEPHEEKGALKQVIKNCKRFLVEKGYGNSSVVFLLSQVGTDKLATEFLKSIEKDEDICHMVYCSPSRLDDMIHKTQEYSSDDEYTAKLPSKIKPSWLIQQCGRMLLKVN